MKYIFSCLIFLLFSTQSHASVEIDLELVSHGTNDIEDVIVSIAGSQWNFGYLSKNAIAEYGGFPCPENTQQIELSWRTDKDSTTNKIALVLPEFEKKKRSRPQLRLIYANGTWKIEKTLSAAKSKTKITQESINNASKTFLKYIYGDSNSIESIVWPNDDVWMLKGSHNPKALEQIDGLSSSPFKTNGMACIFINDDHVFVETRDGFIDPRFNLEEIYEMHRKLVKLFVYAAACGNEAILHNICTDVKRIDIIGSVDGADADVIGNVASRLPVVRNHPLQHIDRKRVFYLVPLGENIALVELVKIGAKWKINSDKGIKIDVSFFLRKHPAQ